MFLNFSCKKEDKCIGGCNAPLFCQDGKCVCPDDSYTLENKCFQLDNEQLYGISSPDDCLCSYSDTLIIGIYNIDSVRKEASFSLLNGYSGINSTTKYFQIASGDSLYLIPGPFYFTTPNSSGDCYTQNNGLINIGGKGKYNIAKDSLWFTFQFYDSGSGILLDSCQTVFHK